MTAIRNEGSITALALIAMLLQLFFATVHLSAPLTKKNPEATSSIWEICTGAGLVRFDDSGNPIAPVPLDGDDCSICASAAVNGDLDVCADADFFVSFAAPVRSADFVATVRFTFWLFPRAGSSRAPPEMYALPRNLA